MLLTTPLALLAYCLLLSVASGSLLLTWRGLKANDRLQVKIDWLRSALVTRDSTIRSYETGHGGEVTDDTQKTHVIPSLPPPRRR